MTTTPMPNTDAIKSVEWQFACLHHGIGMAPDDIGRLTGFLSPNGLMVAVPDDSHATFLDALKAIGVTWQEYQCEYGAIRMKSKPQGMNVEVFREPTDEQLRALSRLRCRVWHDFWGDAWSSCPDAGVSHHRLMLDIRAYSERVGEWRYST